VIAVFKGGTKRYANVLLPNKLPWWIESLNLPNQSSVTDYWGGSHYRSTHRDSETTWASS